MKKYFFYFLSAFLLLSCSSETVEIDTDLRFAINTAPGSRGLSSFILPKSDELSRIPQDPNNPLSPAKVKLGQLLFHESAFGTVGKFTNLKQTYSCASCHNAEAGFQSGRKQGLGDGAVGFGLFGEGRKPEQLVEMSKIDAQALKTPSILNVAYQSNLSWNGQMGATGVNKGHEALWPDEGPLSVNKLGFEAFTFKKLGKEIESPESSIYRYFESKHILLLYLTSWYWSWLEYKIVLKTMNITSSIEKLSSALEILTEVIEVDQSISYIDESKLAKTKKTV